MKRRIAAGLLASLLVIMLVILASASGGTSSDPVVSKSYVDKTFFDSIISKVSGDVDAFMSSFKNKYSASFTSVVKNISVGDKYIDEIASLTLEALQSRGKYMSSSSADAPITLVSGDVISGGVGTVITITEGSAVLSSGNVIDITRGKSIAPKGTISGNSSVVVSENGGKVEITSNHAKVLVEGTYALSEGYKVKYTDEAYALKKLGLVRGAANGMELYRGNTRAESITMLIRLLGEEESALSVAHEHPFGDVDAWAERYVGYAYRMGYTKGVSKTRYDGSSMTIPIQYMTFILRALGYSEEAGDFRYETALSDAVRLGVIDETVKAELESAPLRRDGVMHISYLAMSAKVKDSNQTLLAKLVVNGVVSSSAANEFLRNK